MKVLIADRFEQSGIDALRALGLDVLFQPELKEAALAEALGTTKTDVLVVRSTKVTDAIMEASTLSLIVRAGAGYDTIDVKSASRRGIYVSNCPGKNSIAVAELAFGLILALDRRIPDNVFDLRAGRWNKKEYSKAPGLHGRTLGLLGFGSIGQEMAKRAQAFGMHLAVWSEIGVKVGRDGVPADMPVFVRLRATGEAADPIVKVYDSPAEVAANCDILSVHVALNDRTRGVVGADVFAAMKPGAYFVNTARGEVVDYKALEAAVKEKHLRVALDVYAKEPATPTADFADALIQLPGVYGTHHIGASTDQSQDAIAAETVRIIQTYVGTGRVPNVVNLSRKTPATHVLVTRHQDRPGVLAHVFDRLREAGINVEETENIIFADAEAAVARISIKGEPPADVVAAIKSGNPHVLDVHVVAVQ
ncbi:MAG: 3-phosphoglycerate dehydrogenase family protein [Acidobacteria bacterium]|nr:3-phosphoglycerate dehydrogenase family protein [Acidobacteriota bacterium]